MPYLGSPRWLHDQERGANAAKHKMYSGPPITGHVTQASDVVRVASRNIERHVDPSPRYGVAVLVAMLLLFVVAGAVWVADWREEARETRRAVERCR